MVDPQNYPELSVKENNAKKENSISERVQAMADQFKNFADNAKNQNPEMDKIEEFVEGALDNLLNLVPAQ